MIASLQGTISFKADDFIILEVQGVGYKVFLSERSMESIPEKGSELKVFCYLNVTERDLKLYGFLSFEELELFSLLRTVSGIGPAAALDISCSKKTAEIKKAIQEGDLAVFKSVKGIGKKKAQKIVLELSGKLKQTEQSKKQEKEEDDEAISALMNLGFKKQHAKAALAQVSEDIKDSQEKVKQALKLLGK